MEQYILNGTIKNVKQSFNDLGLNHDEFMGKLMEYGGVIAGSFMFMNFAFGTQPGKNFLDSPKKFNDIDVYIHSSLGHYNPKVSSCVNNYYHPFEHYIMENITNEHEKSDTYIFTDGIIMSKTFKTSKIDINVTLLSDFPIRYIFSNFDLDCCKIVYDGVKCHVYNINELILGVTSCKYNKCTLDHVYKDDVTYDLESNKIPPGSTISKSISKYTLKSTDAFIRFVQLFYEYRKSTDVDNSGQYDAINSTIPPAYSDYLRYISLSVDIDELFSGVTCDNIMDIELTDDIVKVISMIRTHERIDKYKNYGIKKVYMRLDKIFV